VVIVAHTRGPGRVIVEEDAFVGPHCVIACGAGRTLTIGAGAVIGPGCVITRSVAPRAYLALPAPRPVATVGVPLPAAVTMDEFVAGLRPWAKPAELAAAADGVVPLADEGQRGAIGGNP
jgi:hypothetical protein